MKNQFGGKWTEQKIKIVYDYAKAYLTIMAKYKDKFGWKIMYFDGFAGTGKIENKDKETEKEIEGVAKKNIIH